MAERRNWTRAELLFALALYSRLPFGRMDCRNPDVISLAEYLGRTPGSVAMKLGNFAAIDPTLDRKGLSGYAAMDKIVFEEFFSDETLMISYDSEVQKILEKDPLSVKEDSPDYFCEDVVVPTNVRRRQDLFRKIVLSNFDGKCCVTGIDQPELLVASHIIPWRSDKQNRLNPHNGLCLNALHDKAFDRGLITLDESMKVVLSPHLPRIKQLSLLLDYENQQICVPQKFTIANDFLKYHREHIFQAC